MRFAVLGSLKVRDMDADITPSALMLRRLLAILLLHANHTVTISTLIEELWVDDPPRLVRKIVQTYVSSLRKVVHRTGPAGQRPLLETRPGGYALHLDRDQLDVWEFENLVDGGRAAMDAGDYASAADVLRGALSLWRGGAVADIEPGPLLSGRISQLEEMRLAALELRIDADMELGRHRHLLGELKMLTAYHPLHEEFCAQLMISAYRAGQRRTALEAYGRLRSALVKELGIEPPERLRHLRHLILNEAPSLDLADSRAVLPPEPGPVVRRPMVDPGRAR
ncbi:AfsR/SARP family transcriptional regulator [Streptantibioticus ferralitis]|uniref:AfsR/SARP family transcriptional regulator n=1 Tax=Streptantibioticus ferralitis TaxID=236510 RepID=A0ABT5Z9Z5_9ACTN|nr:AfsR/SARP family transcriptional regulator [Streptantibioticus ferralitis]MDF2260447.1 AfsR/SARP family transcriptional regulator [Streptantibioticus ferralitis]